LLFFFLTTSPLPATTTKKKREKKESILKSRHNARKQKVKPAGHFMAWNDKKKARAAAVAGDIG